MNASVQKFDPTRPAGSVQEIRGFLENNLGRIASVAASVIRPEVLVRIVASAASRNPLLAKSTPLSILQAVMDSADMGLECESGMDEAHLVPYWNRKAMDGQGAYEAQLIVGYRGLCRLARQSGEIAKIEAHVVYTKDEFRYSLGIHTDLVHVPFIDGDRGEVRAFYARARLSNGEDQFEVMSKAEVDAIMNRGKVESYSPWKTDYVQMGRKTPLRRLCNYLPKDKALAKALEVQARVEAGQFASDFQLAEVSGAKPTPVLPAPVTATDKLRGSLVGDQPKAAEMKDPEPKPADPEDHPEAGGSPDAPPASNADTGPKDQRGPFLTEKQEGSMKGIADKHDVPHDLSRAVIIAVSHTNRDDARKFADEVYSKEAARIVSAFLDHPAAAPFKA